LGSNTQLVRHHRAGIPGVLANLIRRDSLHPLDHFLAAIRRRLRYGFGRHLLALDPLHQQIPMAEILHDRLKSGECLQIQLSGRRLATVTTGTILVEQGALTICRSRTGLAGRLRSRRQRTAPARYKTTVREREEIILETYPEQVCSKLAPHCVRVWQLPCL
jgi:hypothetical protein